MSITKQKSRTPVQSSLSAAPAPTPAASTGKTKPKRTRSPTTPNPPASASSPETPSPVTFPGMVSPPPSVLIPAPPAGFVAPAARLYAGYFPTSKELAAAPLAITNLQNFVNFAEILGSAAPAAANVATAIQVGIQWRAMRTPAILWDAYVRAQYGEAWKVALTLLDELKPLFLNAVAKNPELASQYQGLAEMLDAPTVYAKQAAATKRKKAKAKAAAAVSADTTANASSVAGTAPAAPTTEAPAKAGS